MQIPGAELVTNVFGYWPSFHDAEVVRLALERTESWDGPSLAADIHTFEITSEVGANGQYILRHNILVSFRFGGVDQLRIEGFNNQNALMGLSIVDIRSRQLEDLNYEVRFAGCFGVDAELLCRSVSVEGVRPWLSRSI